MSGRSRRCCRPLIRFPKRSSKLFDATRCFRDPLLIQRRNYHHPTWITDAEPSRALRTFNLPCSKLFDATRCFRDPLLIQRRNYHHPTWITDAEPSRALRTFNLPCR
ncbi:uncharacterized protein LOC119768102 [Culex quinquefasciatus]|uniref:uncharacterized protein LOC119768102 n=1 Tax=Culex quinquefasciatus TaxID=7176 RepID=UPI0018E3638B|nr:uncharacterized protein LOC119768102 [Culex quinquefasciatus]